MGSSSAPAAVKLSIAIITASMITAALIDFGLKFLFIGHLLYAFFDALIVIARLPKDHIVNGKNFFAFTIWTNLRKSVIINTIYNQFKDNI